MVGSLKLQKMFFLFFLKLWAPQIIFYLLPLYWRILETDISKPRQINPKLSLWLDTTSGVLMWMKWAFNLKKQIRASKPPPWQSDAHTHYTPGFASFVEVRKWYVFELHSQALFFSFLTKLFLSQGRAWLIFLVSLY